MMSKKLPNMSVQELKEWLKLHLSEKWSERDIIILSKTLFDEYQISSDHIKQHRTDREFFAKMLIKGKIKNGISLED